MRAHRIHTAHLLLRCWSRDDAPALMEAIEASLEHLRRWMPWAHQEPEGLEHKAARLDRYRSWFDSGGDLLYGAFDQAQTKVLGGTGLHRRIGAGAGDIGYWIRAEQVGRGLGTEAAGALTRVGFEVEGLQRIEIHCDPANVASAVIPRKLGFRHQVTVPDCVMSPTASPRDTMIWTLLRDEYPSSRAAAGEIEAFDARGNRIL